LDIMIIILILIFGLAWYLRSRLSARRGRFIYHFAAIIYFSMFVGYMIGDKYGGEVIEKPTIVQQDSSTRDNKGNTSPKTNTSVDLTGAFTVRSVEYVRSNNGFYDVSFSYYNGNDLETFTGTLIVMPIDGSTSYVKFPNNTPLKSNTYGKGQIILYLTRG
jgi:hypothetical protein